MPSISARSRYRVSSRIDSTPSSRKAARSARIWSREPWSGLRSGPRGFWRIERPARTLILSCSYGRPWRAHSTFRRAISAASAAGVMKAGCQPSPWWAPRGRARGGGGVAADQDRDVAADGLGEGADGVEGEEAAVVGGAFIAPAGAHHGQRLVAPGAALVT